MIRRVLPLLLPLLLIATLHAQPYPPGVVAGPARRVAELRMGGDTLDDYLVGVVPDGDGFRAYYYFGRGSDNVHTVHIGIDGQTDFASDRPAFASTSQRNYFLARTTGARTILFWIDASRNVRVSPAAADGTALNPSGTLLAPDASYLKAGCNSSRCLVQSWHQPLEGTGDDEIINTAGEVVARIAPPLKYLLVSADPEGFLLVGGAGDLHASRIDNAGRETFDAIVRFGGNATSWAGDFDGHQYSLLWSNESAASKDYATYAAHVGLDGSVSSARKIADLDHERFGSTSGDVVWNGQEHVYVRGVSRPPSPIPELAPESVLSVLRLDRNLIPADDPQPLSTPGGGLARWLAGLGMNRGTAYAAWNEGFGQFAQSSSMHGARVDASGAIAVSTGIEIGPVSQVPEAVATTADVTVAIYSELDTNTVSQVYPLDQQLRFVRVGRSGMVIDRTPHVLTDLAYSGRVVASALASDVLVVWDTDPYADTFLQAAIIHTSDGSFDQFALPVPGHLAGLAIATNGTGWLVANGPYLAAVSRSGLVLNPAAVRYTTFLPSSVSIASDGNRYLVAWEDKDPRKSDNGTARVAVVNGDGSIAVAVPELDTAAYSLSVVFTGNDYLLASTNLQITRLTHISRDGALTPSSVIVTSTHVPQLATFGTGIALASDTGKGLSAIRLTSSGTPIDTKPFPLPFKIMTMTSTATLLGLTTIPADLTKTAAALQELIWQSTAIRRALSH